MTLLGTNTNLMMCLQEIIQTKVDTAEQETYCMFAVQELKII
jgi:hypothetical protein